MTFAGAASDPMSESRPPGLIARKSPAREESVHAQGDRLGSTELVQTLIERDLVDELRVTIDPLVVGGGKRIFRDDGVLRPLRLVDSEVTTTGAILATYAPAAR